MNLIAKIRHRLSLLFRQRLFVNLDTRLDTKLMGDEGYGGWHIATQYLDENSVVYSFGVGEDVSFDLALISEFGVGIYAFDPTPRSINWVNSQDLPKQFKMFTYGIAGFDGEVSFNPPENPQHVSHTILNRPETEASAIKVEVKRLSNIMQLLGHDSLDLLKMDIEGAEYGVIDDIIVSNLRPKQIVIEFHHRFPSVGIGKTKYAIRQLRQAGYQLYWVSHNREEFSFILDK